MKIVSKFMLLLMVSALVLSGCQAIIATPVEPTATEASVTEEIPEVVVPTDEASVEPTEPLPVVDDEGLMVCTPSARLFPELTEEQKEQLSIFPEISEEDWQKGPEDAIMTIMVYTDFQCPYCSLFAAEADVLMEKYPDDVRLIYRPLPLDSIHPNATLAAQAAEAAGEQGKFWEMHDDIFAKQSDWNTLTLEAFTDWLTDEADEIGLDVDSFVADMTSDEIVDRIAGEIEYASSIGLSSTPTVIINGYPWQYSWSAADLGTIIDALRVEANMVNDCPPFLIDQAKSYTATIEVEGKGDIVLELYPAEAPLAVNSFVYLARKGFYDGVTFHRVLEGFMAQSGDPSGTGMSGAGYEYREEISDTLSFSEGLVVGVAKSSEPATSGSQFFITFAPAEWLNGQYTVFGRLIEGEDVLNSITLRDPEQSPDFEGDRIVTITIDEK